MKKKKDCVTICPKPYRSAKNFFIKITTENTRQVIDWREYNWEAVVKLLGRRTSASSRINARKRRLNIRPIKPTSVNDLYNNMVEYWGLISLEKIRNLIALNDPYMKCCSKEFPLAYYILQSIQFIPLFVATCLSFNKMANNWSVYNLFGGGMFFMCKPYSVRQIIKNK